MTQELTAICDECHQETPVKFKERKLTGAGNPVGTYFKCVNCYAKYTAFITNAKVRRLQKETNKLRIKHDKTADDIAVINTNQEFVDAKMGELKTKYND